jgi:predicted transglutaminase-like cysteine proteinase
MVLDSPRSGGHAMRSLGFLLLLTLSLCSTLALAKSPYPISSTMNLGDETTVPQGWIDFCDRYVGECPASLKAEMIILKPAIWKQIIQVNKLVNRDVAAMSDMDHWGLIDRWDYPLDGRGDCEDLALLKRKMLIKAGLPASTLLMTVVNGSVYKEGKVVTEGHAILTIVTDEGDYILDTKDSDVVPWDWTGYKFLKRQSPLDPSVWLEIKGNIS